MENQESVSPAKKDGHPKSHHQQVHHNHPRVSNLTGSHVCMYHTNK